MRTSWRCVSLPPFVLTYLRTDTIVLVDMQSIDHILSTNLYLSPRRSLLYVTDTFGPAHAPLHRLDHLSCFFPGLLALGVTTLHPSAFPAHSNREMHLWAAVGLGETCWRMYADAPSGLGPEVVGMALPPKGPDAKPNSKTTNVKWADAVAKWKKGGMRGEVPGTEEKGDVTDGSLKDYDLIRTDHFLRPEVRWL